LQNPNSIYLFKLFIPIYSSYAFQSPLYDLNMRIILPFLTFICEFFFPILSTYASYSFIYDPLMRVMLPYMIYLCKLSCEGNCLRKMFWYKIFLLFQNNFLENRFA